MPVLALWSAPRSRSTAFFRSMLERGDLLALHEPLEGLMYLGPIGLAGRRFDSPTSLIAWLLNDTHERVVFVKETVNRPVLDLVLANERLLTEVRHAFLIRRPVDIALSWCALEPDMRIQDTGIEALHELYVGVGEAGGHRPVVIESDDLVARPEATMAAYCAAVGLPFVVEALRWTPGEREEWRRSARWHLDASASAGFEVRAHPGRDGLESSEDVTRFVARHLPFYERLHAERVDVQGGPHCTELLD